MPNPESNQMTYTTYVFITNR